MLALLVAAAVATAPSEADVRKAVDQYTVCRKSPFPQREHDVAGIEAAKAAYVREHGGTVETRREIEVACVLYDHAYHDGSRDTYATQRELRPGVQDAIEQEINGSNDRRGR